MAQTEVDALVIGPRRALHPQGRKQRAAAARVPNQRDAHLGRGGDARDAATTALQARQQHARETSDLVAKRDAIWMMERQGLGDGRQK
jgi:hypothetical protein